MLCALTAQVGGTLREDSFSGLFHAASVLCASAVIFPIVTDLFQTVSSVLQSAGGFITAFVPVYSAILAASGQPVGAALVRDGALSGRSDRFSCELKRADPAFNGLSCALYGGGGMSGPLHGRHHGRGEGDCNSGGRPFDDSVCGAIVTEGSLAGAADSVTLRTAKFAAGAVFPVVGGAVSDALSSVQGSMSLLRSSVGGFASIAIMAMLLPPFYPCF